MELLTFIRLFLTSRVALIVENLFLRKQLALFQERKAKPRRTTASFRLRMVALARFFVWRDALVVVKPETFLNWHRTAFQKEAPDAGLNFCGAQATPGPESTADYEWEWAKLAERANPPR